MTSSMRRQFKNVVKNYSDAQVKVREATSNDPWGPSSTLMSEIADLTYNMMALPDIMTMVWKRLNDHGKNWRHVYKALVLLDYIIKTGSEKVAQQCKENIYTIQTLKDFQYVEEGKDHGMNVREKAKQLINLLKDDERLKNERTKAMKAKERLAQNPVGIGSGGQVTMQQRRSPALSPSDSFSTSYNGELRSPQSALPVELEQARPATHGEEELQLQLALAMSKEEYDEDAKRKKADELKLQMALEESRKENQKEGPPDSSLLDMGAAAAMPSSNSLGQLADPWGGQGPAASHPPADPWGGPSAGGMPLQLSTPPQNRQQPPANDPWSASNGGGAGADPWGGSPTPASQSQQHAPPYPWGEQAAAPQPQLLASKTDPWSVTPPRSTAAPPPASTGSPWEPFPANGHTSQPPAEVTLDDEFDLLSSRKSPQTVSKPKNDVQADPWDLGGLGDSLPANPSPVNNESQKPKDAKDFLGIHKDLVNMDQLVVKPSATNNPFAMTTSQTTPNPFNQNGATQKSTPINQMSSSASMGFGQPTNTGILPTPLVQSTGPGMGYPQPVGVPPQGPPPQMGMGAVYPPPSYPPGYQMNQTYGQPMGNNPFM